MSRRFESADPLRRGPRRPPAALLRAAAQRAAQSDAGSSQSWKAPASPAQLRSPGPTSGVASPAATPYGATPRGATPQTATPASSTTPEPGTLQPPMQEFTLKMCTEQDLQDVRYHILKFRSQAAVDPAQDFVPPIRMHRKDPKQLQVLAAEGEDEDTMDVDVKSETGGVKPELAGGSIKPESKGINGSGLGSGSNNSGRPGANGSLAAKMGGSGANSASSSSNGGLTGSGATIKGSSGVNGSGSNGIGANNRIGANNSSANANGSSASGSNSVNNGNGSHGSHESDVNGNKQGDGKEKEETRPKRRPFGRRRKTMQVHGGEKNEKARKLRYEEHYPWIMEDFDNKNTWISSYEAAQSNNYAILTYDAASNGFKLIPIEKVYKMTPATRYATLSLEDAEKKMESKHTMRDRWMMSHLQPKLNGSAELPMAEQLHHSSNGAGFGGFGSGSFGAGKLRTVVGSEERKHKYTLDEEMDFDDQELFDDDEGAPILDGPEEDLKEAEDRIKQEQLKANELMDADHDGDMDDLFNDDHSKEGKQGRKMRKALRSLEKNQYYDTDDEENPYASSESEESADELENNIVVKQEEADENATHDAAQAAQAAAEAEASSMLVSQFRRKTIDRDLLPRGTVVLQLPPAMLARLPPGEWNPSARRASSTAPADTDPTLLTRDFVRRNIKSGETDLKQLLAALKPKLAENPENRKLLKTYIKEVARHRDGKLILRK